MQNTMVRKGGGMVSWGKKNLELGKNEKGKEKKEENDMKKGEKGLKNASFLAINSKKKFAPPPPSRKLICRGKK